MNPARVVLGGLAGGNAVPGLNELLVFPQKNLMVVRMVGTRSNAGVDLNQMGKLALAACSDR